MVAVNVCLDWEETWQRSQRQQVARQKFLTISRAKGIKLRVYQARRLRSWSSERVRTKGEELEKYRKHNPKQPERDVSRIKSLWDMMSEMRTVTDKPKRESSRASTGK
jgi:hypothetical protein